MLRKSIILITFLIASHSGFAQGYGMHIDTVSACPGDTISFGLWMENFTNIGAVTLFIRYDSASLVYLGHSNVHTSFPGVLSNGMTSPAIQVGISWSASLSGVNGGTAKLLDLNFRHKGGGDTLTFSPLCEIADYSANVLTVGYQNGLLQHFLPPIILQPQSDTVKVSQGTTVLSCEASGNVGYKWYAKDVNGMLIMLEDNMQQFSGTGTKDLTIDLTAPNISQIAGWEFFCRITGCGWQWTDPATVYIIDDVGIIEAPDGHIMKVWPVPADAAFNIEIPANLGMQSSLVIYSADGRKVLVQMVEEGVNRINTQALPAGQYLLQWIPAFADSQSYSTVIVVRH